MSDKGGSNGSSSSSSGGVWTFADAVSHAVDTAGDIAQSVTGGSSSSSDGGSDKK